MTNTIEVQGMTVLKHHVNAWQFHLAPHAPLKSSVFGQAKKLKIKKQAAKGQKEDMNALPKKKKKAKIN